MTCSYYDKNCAPCMYMEKPCDTQSSSCERLRRLNVMLQKENYEHRVNPIRYDD